MRSWIWLLYDYFFDTDSCRSQGRSYWIITLILSIIPIPGLNSLYRGKGIDGIFELMHGFLSYISSGALSDISRGRFVDEGLGAVLILFTLVMDAAKYVYYTETEAMDDLVIIILLTGLAVFVGAICSDRRSFGLAIALGLAAPTLIIKWIEHLFMTLANVEVDVNKCALVSIFELFK